MSEEKLVALFIPALGALLLATEDKKGSPLTEQEALAIRDNANVMMVTPAHAASMDESRGYADLDPENYWYDWQMLRRELGRKPDLDPGARFSYVNDSEEAYRGTITDAQRTLSHFRTLMAEKRGSGVFAQVKALLEEPGYRAYLWLLVREDEGTGFVGEIYELPGRFTQFTLRQQLAVQDADVMDWMILEGETLYGGYSLRHNRVKLDAAGRQHFDEHLGVRIYA